MVQRSNTTRRVNNMNDEGIKKELTKGEAILQLKMVNGVSALHIQGYAETEYNREYGFAVNLTTTGYYY